MLSSVGSVNWGTVPDYFIVLSILVGSASLVLQRRWERRRDAAERNRQARLTDLRQTWTALAPLVALPRGFDDDNLAQPFAAAVRQLQLSGSEQVLGELEKVTSTLLDQGQQGAAMSVDLAALINAVRGDYRSLLDLEPTTRKYVPFFIVRRAVAERLRQQAAGIDAGGKGPPEGGTLV